MRIDRHQKPPRGNKRIPYRVFAHDDTGEIALTFFHANGDWLEKTLPVGETRYVSGRMEWFNGRPTMVHPDHIVGEADFASLPLIEPVYPMTAGLVARRRWSAPSARRSPSVPPLPEWLDAGAARAASMAGLRRGAGRAPITRQTAADLEPTTPASLAPRLRRAAGEPARARRSCASTSGRATGKARKGDGRLRQKLIAALPFTPDRQPGRRRSPRSTPTSPGRERMLRLLQGDVGSGKTVVALLAAANVIEAGGQAAIMAPTELLVRQHARTIQPLADAAGIRIAVLTGRERGREREDDPRRPRRRLDRSPRSAPTRSSRPASSSATSRSSSSTSSTASASTSASRSPPRAAPPTCW